MMIKKNMADMKGRMAGAAGSPIKQEVLGLGQHAAKMQQHAAKMQQRRVNAMGLPGSPGLGSDKMFRGDVGSSTPFSTLKPQPQQATRAEGTYGMKKGGKVKSKKMMDGGMAYSKGGSASSRADGIARKGKTKGKMV